jgi:hypothetical protein
MAKIRIYKFTLCFLYYSNTVINKICVSKYYLPEYVAVIPLISYETLGIAGFQNACK